MVDQPYNSLGQILASGGGISVSLAIARGWSEDKILAMINRRYSPVTADVVGQLLGEGQRLAEAGLSTDLDNDDPAIALQNIPIEESLTAEQLDGGRTLYIGQVSFDDGETWFEIRIIGTGDESDIDIVDAMMEEAERRAGDSPGRFRLPEEDEPHATNVQILSKVRRF